jgi:hypothetical protein
MAANQLQCYLDKALEFLAGAFFTMAQLVGQGIFIIEASRSYSDTHTQTVGKTPLDE